VVDTEQKTVWLVEMVDLAVVVLLETELLVLEQMLAVLVIHHQ
jgi:hypothetical protein